MNTNFFNLSNRKKRDVLAELLSGTSTEGVISKKELIDLNKFIESIPTNATTVKIGNHPDKIKKVSASGEKQRKTKKKTTCYLSQENFRDLGNAKIKMQSIVKGKHRSRISKSQIVDHALSLILKEFDVEGEKSRLMRIIMQEI